MRPQGNQCGFHASPNQSALTTGEQASTVVFETVFECGSDSEVYWALQETIKGD